MNIDQKLLQSAYNVVTLLDKVTDENLPKEIAGVVKLHSKIAVGSALVPVPGVDVAGSAAAIWGMYLRINKKIDLSISENMIKTIAAGVGTNLSAYVATLGIGSAMKFIPGIGSVGGAIVMAGAMYALTLASGYVYLQALTMMLKKDHEIDASKLKDSVNSVINENKDTIKQLIEDAKKYYKKNKDSI